MESETFIRDKSGKRRSNHAPKKSSAKELAPVAVNEKRDERRGLAGETPQ